MEKITLKSELWQAQPEELSAEDRELLQLAIEQTERSYAPYSRFSVGAAVRLANGVTVRGCNQENAAFSVTVCAERSALFSAGASHPDQAVTALAIAARDASGELLHEPVTPCGTCRQALVETETRFGRPVRLLLYGKRCVYVADSVRALLPLSFTEY